MCFHLMSEQGIKNFPVLYHLLLGCVSALSRQLIRMLRSHQTEDHRKPEIVSLDDSYLRCINILCCRKSI